MSSLKLYLIQIDSDNDIQISIYRELYDAQHYWANKNNQNCIGIIHSSFVKPIVNHNLNIDKELLGKVFVTGSLKWSLPKKYHLSEQHSFYIKLDEKDTPCYLACNNWGYTVNEINSKSNSNNDRTIVEAAEIVLKDAGRPLNKEEIYALIVENDLYHFGAKKPVNVLNVEMNRNVVNSTYEDAVLQPRFIKTYGDRFSLIGDDNKKQEGWVRIFADMYPDLYSKIAELEIYCDEEYLENREQINHDILSIIDLKRHEIIREDLGAYNFGKYNFEDFIKSLPKRILESDIESLGFTVRITNVFKQYDINIIEDLMDYNYIALSRLPNIGKKSIDDLVNTIEDKVNDLSSLQLNFDQKKTSDPEKLNTNSSTIHELLSDEISEVPLISHLERTLSNLSEREREILHLRLGYNGIVNTLQEVGTLLKVTRERVRQIQKKYIEKIIKEEYWDDVIGLKIGQLLINRKEPLYLEFLEVEDSWFKGFNNLFLYLENVIQMFSENFINVIQIKNRKVITRISENDWGELIRNLKKDLKEKADDKEWTKKEIGLILESNLANFNAEELYPLLNDMMNEFLVYDGNGENAILVSYGRSAQSAVSAVLHQAESPLHYDEIARRASEILGKKVDVRRAEGAALSSGAKLYGPSTAGLKVHNPISSSLCQSIRLIVEHKLYEGPINKQWHSNELIEELRAGNLNIPDDLDDYLLGIILDDSEKITYLNRMVWARADSGLNSGDRIEVADAIVNIIEDAGHPLTGKEIREKLSEVRGVSQYMQVYPSERVMAVGPNIWGLVEWQHKMSNEK